MAEIFSQIFFSIITAVFSLGQAAPHLQAMAQARGAAYTLWLIIDTVRENARVNSSIFSYIIIYSHQKFQVPLKVESKLMT